MPQVSIIVPVYGAEKYLHRCLDSILAQTFTNWECILVDDGSKDHSGAICDEYSQKDSRFRVFHKENGGVSSARQYGMERMLESDSKYSIHVDPDDWVESIMLERLFQKAEDTGTDMVICDYYKNTSKSQIYKKEDPSSENPLQVLDALFHGLHGSLCNKLIKSVCYKDANIKFPVGLNYCEDFYVNVCMLLKSIQKVAYLPEAFYHYDCYSNNQSAIRNINKRNVDYTRSEIVRLCRQVVPESAKGWQYYLFEIQNAFSIIKNGSMTKEQFKKIFVRYPFIVLLHTHGNFFQVFLTYLVIYTPVPIRFVSRFYNSFFRIKHNVAKSLRISRF